MIRSVEELKKETPRAAAEFLRRCKVEEKLDAYYFTTEVRSKKTLAFVKSSGRIVDKTDLVLNEMWQRLVNDWTYFRLANPEWFEKRVGWKVHAFYFPCRKPVLTEYKPGVSYVVDRLENGSEAFMDPEPEMGGMEFLDKFGIRFKKTLKTLPVEKELEDEISRVWKDGGSVSELLLKSYLDPSAKDDLYASDEPEGYVLKGGRRKTYQIALHPEECRTASAEKSQYEYFLADFEKYWASLDDIGQFLSRDYVKTVCNLFDGYVAAEPPDGGIESELTAESLEGPCVGKRFGLCYENVPDAETARLCRESDLRRNMFKILLVNLRRPKDPAKTMLMSPKEAAAWNDIVDTLAAATV